MKKKILSMVLCAVLVCVSLTACGGEDAYTVINEAIEKTQNLDAMSAKMEMEMGMSLEGMTMSIPMTVDIKGKDLKSDAPVMSMIMSMSLLGESMEILMYQEGTTAYMVIDDVKYKTDISNVEGEYDYADDIKNMTQQLPEELFTDVKLTNESDGSKSVTIEIPDEMFAEIYGNFITGMDSAAGVGIEEISISNAVVSLSVAKGYIVKYDMSFDMAIDIEGISTETNVKAVITYGDPTEEVTVTPPEGYKDFDELGFDL